MTWLSGEFIANTRYRGVAMREAHCLAGGVFLFLMFSRGRRTCGFGEETRAVEVIRVTAGGVFWCKSTPTRTRHVHATRARYTSVLVSCFFLPSILCEYFLAFFLSILILLM